MGLFGHAGRLARLQAGIGYLREDRRRHRRQVFRQLVEYWGELGPASVLGAAPRAWCKPGEVSPEAAKSPPNTAVAAISHIGIGAAATAMAIRTQRPANRLLTTGS